MTVLVVPRLLVTFFGPSHPHNEGPRVVSFKTCQTKDAYSICAIISPTKSGCTLNIENPISVHILEALCESFHFYIIFTFFFLLILSNLQFTGPQFYMHTNVFMNPIP